MAVMKKVVILLSDDALDSDARVYNEANALKKSGYLVTALVWNRKGRKDGIEEYNGIEIERIAVRVPFAGSQRLLFLFIFLFNFKAFFKLLNMDFDVIHCNDMDTLFPGLLAAKIKNRKIIYDAHEIYPLMIQSYITEPVAEILSIIELYFVRKVDSLVTVSEVLADYYKKGIGKNKPSVTIVMNCKDTVAFNQSQDKVKLLKKNLGIENRFVILYDGWLVPNNGLEELFDAFQKLDGDADNMVAILCGEGYAQESFKETVKKKKITSRIKFIGRVPSQEIPLYVNACDIMYVVRSPTERYNLLSTPNRLFEAMMAGKPVVASNFGNVKKIVEKTQIGLLIQSEDINGLCSSLLQLKNETTLREEFIKKALEASKTYNWDSMEKVFVNVYTQLWARHS